MKKKSGQILWHDLTVDAADEVSEFYSSVLGWEREGLSMGDYHDYVMKTPGDEGEVVAGICHARGVNADIPALWLLYVSVKNLDDSLEACRQKGGKVIGEKRKMQGGWFCLIQDPAGAYMMLSESSED